MCTKAGGAAVCKKMGFGTGMRGAGGGGNAVGAAGRLRVPC